MRSVLVTVQRAKKAAAPPPKKEKEARSDEMVRETSKPGDPIPGLNYMKAGKGANAWCCRVATPSVCMDVSCTCISLTLWH